MIRMSETAYIHTRRESVSASSVSDVGRPRARRGALTTRLIERSIRRSMVERSRLDDDDGVIVASSSSSCFERLGLGDATTTREDVRRAFRRLVIAAHPDRRNGCSRAYHALVRDRDEAYEAIDRRDLLAGASTYDWRATRTKMGREEREGRGEETGRRARRRGTGTNADEGANDRGGGEGDVIARERCRREVRSPNSSDGDDGGGRRRRRGRDERTRELLARRRRRARGVVCVFVVDGRERCGVDRVIDRRRTSRGDVRDEQTEILDGKREGDVGASRDDGRARRSNHRRELVRTREFEGVRVRERWRHTRGFCHRRLGRIGVRSRARWIVVGDARADGGRVRGRQGVGSARDGCARGNVRRLRRRWTVSTLDGATRSFR